LPGDAGAGAAGVMTTGGGPVMTGAGPVSVGTANGCSVPLGRAKRRPHSVSVYGLV